MARHPDGRNSIKHGSGRVAGLARWLEKRPDNALYDTLSLELKVDGEWQRLQAWSRDDVSALLADMINELCQDQANDSGAFSTFRCAWWASESEKYWTTRVLTYHPEINGEPVQSFAGDAQSVAIQTQGALKELVVLFTSGIRAAQDALKESCVSVTAEASALREDNRALRERNAELEAEKAAAERSAEQAADLAEGLVERVEEADKQSNVVDMITKGLVKHAGLPGVAPPGAG
jgi:hypothetical protein